jgi:hypothetical protein
MWINQAKNVFPSYFFGREDGLNFCIKKALPFPTGL